MPLYSYNNGADMTTRQDSYIRKLYRDCYGDDIKMDTKLTEIANSIIRLPVQDYRDLKRNQASKLIKYLERELGKDG